MDYLAKKFKISLDELKKGIDETARFYNVLDFSEEEKIYLHILATVRIVNNDDNLNLYRVNNYIMISYRGSNEKILIDDNVYHNIFSYFDQNNLKY